MSITLDMPDVEPIDDRNWRLLAPFSVWVGSRLFTVCSGFVCNGCSIPRSLWWIVGHPMQGLSLPASLVHDALYRTCALSREAADDIFYALLVRYGVFRPKAMLMYRCVRLFGWCVFKRDQSLSPETITIADGIDRTCVE